MIGFEQLNDMQKKAVLQTEGPVLLLAGAGSGKTGALTVRIAHMLEKGIKPWNILAITFTNKAAHEMRDRVDAMVGEGARDIWVSTFHSACVRILRREIHHIGYVNQFSIYDMDDQEKLMRETFKQLNFSLTDKNYSIKGAMARISKQKETLTSWETYAQKVDKNDPAQVKTAKVYQLYQTLLKENQALDFDDLIYKTVQLFRAEPAVLERYQDRFRYIMVDEYQDTNMSQYELVRLLSAKYQNLCVVGDDDQSIYSFRGADIRNILEFEKDFSNTMVIKLEQNYRSTKTILEAANAVIHNNSARKDKTLWTDQEKGRILSIYQADNEYDEARFAAEEILKKVAEGRAFQDCAILYRTNAQSRVLEDQLMKRKIPYRLFGAHRFYDRREIRDIIAYLKILANPADTISLRRIINVPKRGIGDTSMERVQEFAREQEIGFYDALGRLDEIESLKTRAKKLRDFYELIESLNRDAEGLSMVDLVDLILARTAYLQLLRSEATEDALSRIENLEEFINIAAEYDKSEDANGLAGFLEQIALVADIDSMDANEEKVTLMTLHSAKGLEFPFVYMVGLEEGIFPSFRSIAYGGPQAIEEERRLCYVGITRAREELSLSHAKSRVQHGISQYNKPSRFLLEIPQELVNRPVRPVSEVAKEFALKSSLKIKPVVQKPNPYGMRTAKSVMPAPSSVESPGFVVGDKVRAPKYGIGTVQSIAPGGADFEVEISFGEKGVKKFMAGLSKLKKIQED